MESIEEKERFRALTGGLLLCVVLFLAAAGLGMLPLPLTISGWVTYALAGAAVGTLVWCLGAGLALAFGVRGPPRPPLPADVPPWTWLAVVMLAAAVAAASGWLADGLRAGLAQGAGVAVYAAVHVAVHLVRKRGGGAERPAWYAYALGGVLGGAAYALAAGRDAAAVADAIFLAALHYGWARLDARSRLPYEEREGTPGPGGVVAIALLAAALAAPLAGQSPAPATGNDPLMQTGVSLELARRRAATLSDVRYRLELDVTAADSAPGTVAVTFQRRADAGDLVLDFRGPRLGGVSANGRAVPDAEWRNGHVRVPARYLRGGENRVEAAFTARIAAAGASIIRFVDSTDGSPYLYTLLVPADANQLFPCFDQPDLKARFRTSLIAPAGWKVLSNGPLESSETHGAAVRSTFAETEPISTYLAAFAAGPWRTWRSDDAALPITLYARASRAAEVD
ncbi:MAG TPA: hypothetical protein VFQ45_05795, partial [Longimicrobium sp.]|nr:hypothetical protein [Longimicrobium sp.]